MIRRSLAATVACSVALLVAPPTGTAAQASSDDLVILDVPAGDRQEPRSVSVVGQTSTRGLLIRREVDPAPGVGYARFEDVLLAPDGTTTPAGVQVRDVLGDRVVTADYSSSLMSVVLPDQEPTRTSVPDGYSLLDYTGDGLLLASTSPGAQALALLPWSGGEPLPVAGAPDGVTYGTMWPAVHDISGTVVTAYPVGGAGVEVLVDTSARRAWPLLGQEGLCDARTGTTWAITDDTVAWQTTGAGARQICTQPRPAADADTLPAPQARPAVDLPVSNQWYDVALLPVGDDVVVSRRTANTQVDAPVYRVASDGTVTKLLDWGHPVTRYGVGSVAAVGGPSPAEAAVVRLDLPAAQTTVLAAITPVPATTTALAVDDARVVTMDDSAPSKAVVQRSLTFGVDPRVGEAVVLDTAATDQVAAADGATAWQKNGAWVVRDAAGNTTSSRLPHDAGVPSGTQAVSRQWILYARGYLVDSRQNSIVAPENTWSTGDRDLVDGVLYLRGSLVSSALRDRVVMRDLASGQATSMHVPGCVSAGAVQAAGAWLMARCTLTDGRSGHVVVDRSGGTDPSVLVDSSVILGNGFAVRRGEDFSLDWRPLADTSAEWQSLAPAGAAQQVAVGKASEPNVAWTDGHTTRVARLPVTATVNPPPPVGVTKPSLPQITVTPYHRSITVRWSEAPSGEQLVGYQVRLDSTSTYLGSDAASKTFTGLTNGKTYKVMVTAINIAGRNTAGRSAVPVAPPAAPTNVRARVNAITSRVHVTWDWSATPGSEPLTSFDVGAGGFVGADGLAADARSASFVMPGAGSGPVTVTAKGIRQSEEGLSDAVSFPGLDTVAPSSALRGVPQVTKTSSLKLLASGSDNRRLVGIDVRWRTAGFGRRLGAWTRPAGWQARQPGPLTVRLRAGGTYCFSSRARDAAGNVSGWTPARCTSVVLDDRALTRSGRWASVRGRVFYGNTASRSNAHYVQLSRKAVRASSVWLVATTCPTCGSVRVFSGNTSFTSVSLRSATRRPRALVRVPWPMKVTGTLKIVTWPRWGTVTIDGVAVRSY